MFIILGLGNPGEEYERTRHNLGFRVIDRLGERWGELRLRHSARHSVFVCTTRENHEVVLAKPTTFMNRSGLAAAELLERFEARPDQLLVIYDDAALPPGTIRIRTRGSGGGHNGVVSVIERLGTEEFPRIRLGIGPPRGDGVEHVLSPFSHQEESRAEDSVATAAEAVSLVLAEGINAAMNRYNRKLKEENGIPRE